MLFFKFILVLLVSSVMASPVKKERYYDRNKFYNHKYFEGDILSQSSNSLKYHAITDSSGLWPGGELVYQIEPTVDSGLVLQAMNQITQATSGCIKFREKQDTDFDFVNIFSGEGCFAEVGKKGGQQQLSLGEGCTAIGVYIHELLHTLGFYHHHSRSDRDEYLDIFWENIIPNLASNFKKLDPNENQLLTPFDYQSIMMYGSLAFSKDNVQYTMLPKDYTITISDPGTKSSMTGTDITALRKLYNCDSSPGTNNNDLEDDLGGNNINDDNGNNSGDKIGDNNGNNLGDKFGDKFGDHNGNNLGDNNNDHDSNNQGGSLPILPPIPSLKDYDKHTINHIKPVTQPFKINEITGNFGEQGNLIDFSRIFGSILGRK